MKRSSFRKQSLDEIRAKQAVKRARATKSTPKPKKRATGKIATKKRKVKTQAQLKKELDAIYSRYIRQKYPAKCYTCGKTDTPLHCGHFISRSYLATRWEENNTRPQCVGCNIYGNGKPLDFEERLKAELGDEYVEKMKAKRHESWKLDRHWYQERIDHYKSLVV